MAEFSGLEFDWLAYELMPEELPWETAPPMPEVKSKRPRTPTRMDLAYAAQGMDRPTVTRPKQMRTHNAHEAAEFARTQGVLDAFVGRLYRAYWEEGNVIGDVEVITCLAEGLIDDLDGLREAILGRRFAEKITPFDDGAYATGVYNVPTFWIGEERYAEQPIRVLRTALLNL